MSQASRARQWGFDKAAAAACTERGRQVLFHKNNAKPGTYRVGNTIYKLDAQGVLKKISKKV